MHVLTASTLVLLLAASPVAATQFQLIEPAPSYIPALGKKRTSAPFPLLRPTAESGTSQFVLESTVQTPDALPSSLDLATEPKTMCERLATAATRNGLPVLFFARLIGQESGFDPLAISRAGALGVAQFMPQVAAELGLEDPFDPAQALPMSARFLRMLRDQFGNLGLAAAAYNAGAKRVQDWLERGRRLPKETRDYVRSITGRAPEGWRAQGATGLALKAPANLPCMMPETTVADAAPIKPTDASSAAEPTKQRPTPTHEKSRSRSAKHTPRRRSVWAADQSQKKSGGSRRARAVIFVHRRAGRAAVHITKREERARKSTHRVTNARSVRTASR